MARNPHASQVLRLTRNGETNPLTHRFAAYMVSIVIVGLHIKYVKERRKIIRATWVCFKFFCLPALLMCAPLFTSVVDFLRIDYWPKSLHGITLDGGWISVVLGLIGALAVLAVALMRGVAQRHQSPGFWFVGWFLVSVVSSGVAIIATVSQLLFAYVPPGATLVTSTLTLNQAYGISCDSRIFLMRWDSKPDTPAIYRCPSGLLNPLSDMPFIPWPDYTDSTSVSLGNALRKAVEKAEQEDQ